MNKKQKEQNDLQKAKDHFIKATTEWVIGSGFALKVMKNLLREREGRKLIYDIAGKSFRKGFNIMTNLADILKSQKEGKAIRPKTRGKKTRKIKVE